MDKSITMKPAEFMKEHTNLIDVLKHGSRKQLKAEAKDQKAEVAKYTGGAAPRAKLEEYVAPGTPLDQYIANQAQIHTTGEVRGRTPIHIVTN